MTVPQCTLPFPPHLCEQDALGLQWEAVGGGGCVKVVLETQVKKST